MVTQRVSCLDLQKCRMRVRDLPDLTVEDRDVRRCPGPVHHHVASSPNMLNCPGLGGALEIFFAVRFA